MRKQTRYTNSKFLICKALVCFFFLFSCATNQATDITKSANYKIGDYNEEMSLGFDEADIEYYTKLFKKYGRYPTDIELS